MKLKTGVKLSGLRPQMTIALMVAEEEYARYNIELGITSCNDSKHGYGSKHFSGEAFDTRTKHIGNAMMQAVFGLDALAVKRRITDAIAKSLGAEFDVVFELVGLPHEHIHVEFHPKR